MISPIRWSWDRTSYFPYRCARRIARRPRFVECLVTVLLRNGLPIADGCRHRDTRILALKHRPSSRAGNQSLVEAGFDELPPISPPFASAAERTSSGGAG